MSSIYYDYTNVNIRYFPKSKEKIYDILQLILLKTPIILHVEFTAYIEFNAKSFCPRILEIYILDCSLR